MMCDNTMEAPMLPPVEERVPISRKLYDLVNENYAFINDLSCFSGAYIEPQCSDSQRQGNFLMRNQFGAYEVTTLSQQGHRLQNKGRREYFLRLIGTKSQVDCARDAVARILNNVNPGDRATMKIDVSFADHSFIIGRLGKNIQTVMRATGTHVHFPDSNRNNLVEKSNQVSVVGKPKQVLEARKRIRSMLPVSFVFLVQKADYSKVVPHAGGNDRIIAEELKAEFELLQNEYSMTINWLPIWGRCAMVTVRGRRSNFHRIRQGLIRLMTFLQLNKRLPNVYLGLEVSPHYLNYVSGPWDVKFIHLMLTTGTRIQVVGGRNGRAFQIPTIRVFGQIDNVFKAWTGLMDLLPATLLIDVVAVPQSWHDAVAEDQRQESLNDSGVAESMCMPPVSVAEYVFKELAELQVVPVQSLESALNSALEHENFDELVSAIRTTVKLVRKINEMLYDYDISLLLRLSRDFRQWKIIARGPEGFVNLLMDVYLALTKLDENPLESIREAMRKADPPIRYEAVLNTAVRLHNESTGSVNDSFRTMLTAESNEDNDTASSGTAFNQSETILPVAPCPAGSDYAKVDGQSQCLSQNTHPLGADPQLQLFGGYQISNEDCAAAWPNSNKPQTIDEASSAMFEGTASFEDANTFDSEDQFDCFRGAGSHCSHASTDHSVPMEAYSGLRSPVTSGSGTPPSPLENFTSSPFVHMPLNQCHTQSKLIHWTQKQNTAGENSESPNIQCRGLLKRLRDGDQFSAKFNDLSIADNRCKNIAHLAPGAGRHLFKSGLV